MVRAILKNMEPTGGQSIPNFDYAMADGVRKTFKKLYINNFAKYLKTMYDYRTPEVMTGLLIDILDDIDSAATNAKQILDPSISTFLTADEFPLEYEIYCKKEYGLWGSYGYEKPIVDEARAFAYREALTETEDATYQAMEAVVHNLNTMHCLPASEEIWVYDDNTSQLSLMRMDELHESFEKCRYRAVSLDRESKHVVLKPITASWKKDNHRRLIELTTTTGQKVRTTDNHMILTMDNDNIIDKLPEEVDNVMSSIIYMDADKRYKFGPTLRIDVELRKVLDSGEEYVYDISVADNENFLTKDGIFVHNSRAGAQVPFSSINYGTDTSPEGRMVIKNILLALEAGLGDGETAIWPVHIFRVKEGINYNPDDPSYELFRLACRVSSKRLYPNFSFQDATFNMKYYKPGHPETEISYMGCRTRIIANVYDPTKEVAYSRGNLSFTSINLPRLAIESHQNVDLFFEKLEKMVEFVCDQLYERYLIVGKKKVKNFPFLMGQGVWLDSEGLDPETEVAEILKHGTMSVGFIGLAETLTSLIGKHHGESNEAQELGLKIISTMRRIVDERSQKEKLNYTLIATPAEGLSGRFVKIDKEKYGEIPGVTDKIYYTNSYHVPVSYPVRIWEKIDIEAPYHELTNAGHITYIELDGDSVKNLDAFENIIRYMKEQNIGYGAINHPVDRDPVCGYTGIIDDVCPKCGREEGEIKFERIRRITGYLAGTLDRFNDAKKQEVKDRCKHEN